MWSDYCCSYDLLEWEDTKLHSLQSTYMAKCTMNLVLFTLNLISLILITHANKNDGFPLNAQLSKTFWFADFAYCFLPLTLYTPNILCNTAIILESHSEALHVWSIIHWFLFNSLITLCSWQDGKIQLLTIFSTCLHYCRYLAHT